MRPTWRRHNGGLKNYECRLLLERLRDQGFLTLPPVRPLGKSGPRVPALTAISDHQPPVVSTVGALEPLTVRLVQDSEGPAFRQLIQRYHYLGHRVHPGANLRYLAKSGDRTSSPSCNGAVPHGRWRRVTAGSAGLRNSAPATSRSSSTTAASSSFHGIS
jgi:hypothetical protein